MVLKRVSLVVGVPLAAAGLLLALVLHWRPSMERWERLALPATPTGALQVAWLGTSTLYVTDGRTALLTDGYFSRLPLWRLPFPIGPDDARIEDGLARAGIDRLDAVLVVHSHFDHAMDAPTVAARTGAELVGSESTANLGRGAGLPPSRIRVATSGDALRYGDFEVVFVASDHVPRNPLVDAVTGMDLTIDAPLVPPAPLWAWREGESRAVLIRHPAGTVLVQGSAGFRPGQLDGYRADVAFVSSVGLSRQPPGYVDDYVAHTVAATGARLVIPVHWDDFFEQLDGGTPPLPQALEDLNASFSLLETAMQPLGARLGFLRPGQSLYLPHPVTNSVVSPALEM